MKKWSETYVNNYKEKHKSEEKINPKCVSYLGVWIETENSDDHIKKKKETESISIDRSF